MVVAIGIAAVVVVLLTSLFKTVDMSERVKQVVAVVTSVGVAALASWQQGVLDSGADVTTIVLAVYGLAQALYAFILNGTGLDDKLESVKVIPGK